MNNQGVNDDQLPIKEWGLKELMLCALFFNPKIEIAKKEWDIAKTQEVIAPIKAPSSLGFETGRQTTGTAENSRNAFGLNLTTLFETADKAKIREEKAKNQCTNMGEGIIFSSCIQKTNKGNIAIDRNP